MWTYTHVIKRLEQPQQPQQRFKQVVAFFVLPFLEPSAVAMMSGERDAGSAKRRRERRLRSWLRHERMTVAAELSAALHHSRVGGREPHVGLRAPKTDSTGVEEEVHEAYVVHGNRSDLLRGSGPHLCLRWPGRRRQSRSVTWLRGCLSWVLQ